MAVIRLKVVSRLRRPMINVQNAAQIQLNTTVESRSTVELSGLALEKKLKQKRSQAYLDSMVRLDAMGAVCDRSKVEELIQSIRNEFGELQPHQFMIGIVSKCYLGEPFEVHTLDVRLEILQHFASYEPLPGLLEKARVLAMHPSYAFIEVYSDCMCAVAVKGYVSYTRGE